MADGRDHMAAAIDGASRAEGVQTRGDGQAIGLILLAMLSFAIQDVVVKLVADQTSLWQLQLIRSVAVLVLMTVVVRLMGRGRELIPRRWAWPLARSVAMTGAYLFFYASLPFLTLAQAGAAFFVGPLFITVFAAILLGEPIGPRRIAAVAIGFLGVLVIVQPGAEGWRPVALMPVLAALCYALAMVMTRWRCRAEPGFSLTFTHNLVYAGLGLLGVLVMDLAPLPEEARAEWSFLLTGWASISLGALALVLATAFSHIIGMLASVVAYQRAEASRIAPFEYSYLGMTPALDYLIWGVAPDLWTLIGVTLIIVAGTFVAWREGRPARPRVQFRGELPWSPDSTSRPKS